MPQRRERKKIELLGSYDQYLEQMRDHESRMSEAASVRSQQQEEVKGPQNKTGQQLSMQTGIPNIIGNVEDEPSVLVEESQMTPHLGTPQPEPTQQAAGDNPMYKDITTNLKRSKRNRSKSPL